MLYTNAHWLSFLIIVVLKGFSSYKYLFIVANLGKKQLKKKKKEKKKNNPTALKKIIPVTFLVYILLPFLIYTGACRHMGLCKTLFWKFDLLFS